MSYDKLAECLGGAHCCSTLHFLPRDPIADGDDAEEGFTEAAEKAAAAAEGVYQVRKHANKHIVLTLRSSSQAASRRSQ
jgi:hypothetical protein